MSLALQHLQHDLLHRGQISCRLDASGLRIEKTQAVAAADHQGRGQFHIGFERRTDPHFFNAQRRGRDGRVVEIGQLCIFLRRDDAVLALEQKLHLIGVLHALGKKRQRR
ncbi:hypothetical protein D3C73_1284420 [compost metagenome]